MYLAFVLDERSRTLLLERIPPKFCNVIAHHVTIFYPKNAADTQLMYAEHQAWQADEPIKLEVVRHYVDEHIHAVGVELNGKYLRLDGEFYHVTLSLEPPAKPVDSNKILAKYPIPRFELTGSVKLVG